MRPLLITAVVVLLCGTVLSVGRGAENAGLPGDRVPTSQGDLVVHPVGHASFLLEWNGKTIYVDPVGGAEPFANLPKPDLILFTHFHFDHFEAATLAKLLPAGVRTPIVATKGVAEKIPETLQGQVRVKVLANGEKAQALGIGIEAVPAYNTTPGRDRFHPKGRDNGYVLALGAAPGATRVYIAGDTEDTPEMRALRGIDVAFLPVNLPYTLSVDKAADAIRQFKPKIVYPYHSRSGEAAKTDLEQLKKLVGEQSGVEIRLLDWYPSK